MNLWDLKINTSGEVQSINPRNNQDLGILSELGISKNASVRCLHKTLFGGPRVFEINGTVCSLCKKSCKQVLIKAC